MTWPVRIVQRTTMRVPELHNRKPGVHLAFGATCHAAWMPRIRNVAFSMLALVVVGCQSPPPMQPRLDPAPPALAGVTVKARPAAWPEEVPVPAKALEACSGRTAGESCWLYEEDVARNGDCIELPADGAQACWTTASR